MTAFKDGALSPDFPQRLSRRGGGTPLLRDFSALTDGKSDELQRVESEVGPSNVGIGAVNGRSAFRCGSLIAAVQQLGSKRTPDIQSTAVPHGRLASHPAGQQAPDTLLCGKHPGVQGAEGY